MGILKIGVVGCGRIGKLHINNLINSVPGVQVVAAADPMLDKSGAREWLAERKITNVSTDFMDVINNPEVDVVFVCSSTDTLRCFHGSSSGWQARILREADRL